jgi:hypothetical protein
LPGAMPTCGFADSDGVANAPSAFGESVGGVSVKKSRIDAGTWRDWECFDGKPLMRSVAFRSALPRSFLAAVCPRIPVLEF